MTVLILILSQTSTRPLLLQPNGSLAIVVMGRPPAKRRLYGSILYSRFVTILHAHLLHYSTDTLAAQRMRPEGSALSSPGNKNTATSAIPG